MRRMTIHEALATVKVIDKRIASKIGEEVITTNRRNNSTIGGVSVAEKAKEFEATLQSTKDLFKNRTELKNKIAMSNAVTKIKIAGNEMTIVEAIEEKHFCETRLRWLRDLKSQLLRSQQRADMENAKLPAAADAFVNGLGGKDLKNLSDELKASREEYIKVHTVELVDPCKLGEFIESELTKVEDFVSNIDFRLSESNATTLIEVELVGEESK